MPDRDYYVHYSTLPPEEGGGVLATVPDLPGCMSDGADYLEAEANIRDAIECWIAAARRLGRPIPEPAPSDVRQA
jgi:predicted RNase H-like HicB family nuclease